MLIEKFENIYIAYMQRIGIYGTENKKLMETFKMYIRQKICRQNTTILGIALDDPSMNTDRSVKIWSWYCHKHG